MWREQRKGDDDRGLNLLASARRVAQEYMGAMLSSDALAVTPAARGIAALVLHPPARPVVWPLFEATANITIGLLPPRLIAMYGYSWGRGQQLLFDAWLRSTRRALPHLPPWLREFPMARAAEQRVAGALAVESRT